MVHTTQPLLPLALAYCWQVCRIGGSALSPQAAVRSTRAVLDFLNWYEGRTGNRAAPRPAMTRDLTKAAITQYLDACTQTPFTLRQRHAGLHAFAAWLVEDGELTSNPVDEVPKPASRRPQAVGV